jgi:hypothetical protein
MTLHGMNRQNTQENGTNKVALIKRWFKMKKVSYLSGIKTIIGLFLILTLLRGLACFAFAQTAQDAEFMGRIESFVRDQKAEGVTTYLNPLLGTQLYNDGGRLSTPIFTGLKDKARAYIRGESGKLLSELGSAGHTALLLQDAKAETDFNAREELFLAGYTLKLKTAADLASKQAAIQEFFTACADYASSQAAFNGSIPRQAFEYLLGEAEDDGMTSLNTSLTNLKAGVFKDDANMSSRIDQAVSNINLRAQYPGLALYDAILNLNNPVTFQRWMLRSLIKLNNYQTQYYSNAILNKLLSGDPNGNLRYVLKDMEDNGILRSENPNACLEYGDRTTPPKPSGWQVTLAPGAGNTYKFPVRSTTAASYRNCLEINTPSGGVSATGNAPFTFTGRMPKKIEFGFSYKMGVPAGMDALLSQNGAVYCLSDTFSAPEAFQLSLRVKITLSDNTVVNKEIAESNPYRFYNWETLSGSFACSNPDISIKSVQLGIVINGTVRILYLDDIYCRRSENDILTAGPQISTLTVSPNPAVIGEPVVLTANVTPPVPGQTLTGQWTSSLEGPLGSPVTGSGSLTATVLLTKPGNHDLIFTVKDMLGAQSTGVSKLKILSPALGISAGGKEGGAVSGNLALTLTANADLVELSKSRGVIVTHQLVATAANGNTATRPITTCSTYPCTYTLDTSQYSDGLTAIKVATSVQRSTGGAGSFYFNPLIFYFSNKMTLDPIAVIVLESSDGKNPLTAKFNAGYSVGSITSYAWNFGDGATSANTAVPHSFYNTTTAPKNYTVSLQVRDSRGKTNSASIVVTVPPAQAPPTS